MQRLISLTDRPNPPYSLTSMRWRIPRVLLALGVAVCAGSPIVKAQTWETVDDIDSPAAFAAGVVSDSAGNVFVAGSIKDATGNSHATVMKSNDQGGTWVTLDYVAAATNSWTIRGIVSARIAIGENTFENHLVTASLSGGNKWLIRRSVNAGATWATLDIYMNPNPQYVLESPPSLALDGKGNIFAVGVATETTIITIKGKTTITKAYHPLLRKFEGGVWRTITTSLGVGQIVCSGNNVFGLGGTGDSWQVRKSTDGGDTWNLVDTFRYDMSGTTRQYDIAADSQGNLFVVGMGTRVTSSGSRRTATTLTEQFWLVREGTGSGTVWTTVDVYDLGRPVFDGGGGNFYGAYNLATSLTVDSYDNVHVTGYGVGTQNLRRWITRNLSSGTGLWTTTDDFSLGAGNTAEGWGIAADPFGNMFATGRGGNSSVYHGWLVRRKLVP